MTSVTRTSEEMAQAFDGQGNFVDEKSRAEISKTPGLYPLIIYGFLQKVVDAKIWIPIRQDDKVLYPGLWDASVAEHSHPGEIPEATLVRGCSEELRLRIGHTILNYLRILPAENGSEAVIDAYLLEVAMDEKWHPNFDPIEYTGGQWMHPQQTIGRIEEEPRIARPDLVIVLKEFFDR